MKRFDKGYIFSYLLSDLVGSFAVVLIFLKDFFLNEESNPDDIIAATPIFVIACIAVYLCFIAYRVLYYRLSGYELTENEIRCNRGVLFRRRSVLDYRKVHAINKKQNLFQRFFGVAVLTVDSGSTNTSHEAEITIVEKSTTVDALLNQLNVYREGNTPAVHPKEEVLLSEQDPLYRFTSKRKMLYTLINIVSTSLYTALIGVVSILVIGVCKLMLRLDALGTWGQYFWYAILITVGTMLLFSLFSFVGCMIHSFVGYHNFVVSKCGNDIRISYGLLEKHTNSFRCDRIKAVKISQGLTQRMMGFASIRLEVIGYTVAAGDDHNKNADLGVLVPFCKYDEVGKILERVLPDYVPEKKQTRSVSFFSFFSWFSFVLGIVTSLVLLQTILPMLVFNVSASVTIATALAIVGVGIIVLIAKVMSAVLAFQNNGLSINGGKITAYYGGFTKYTAVFLSKNLIAVEEVTTPLRRKKGITSLVMHLKTNSLSNEIKVHMQGSFLAEKLGGQLIL